MPDRLQVVNAALGLAGVSQRVEDFDDPESEEARAVRSHYEKNVGAALRQIDWNFATRIEALTPVASMPGFRPLAPTESMWLRPTEAIRVLSIYDSPNRRLKFVEDRDLNDRDILITQAAPSSSAEDQRATHYVRFIYRAEEARWTPDFLKVVEHMLAIDLARQLKPSGGPDVIESLVKAADEAMKMAGRTNSVEGGSLVPSNDLASEIQELALILSGARDPAGRSNISTSAEEQFIQDFYELDRQAFLTEGEFPFSRRYLELQIVDPQIDHPATAGYRPFFYKYPLDPCILELKKTLIRYREYEMFEIPWTHVDSGIQGKFIVLNSGYAQGSREDVRATGIFAIDEPDLAKWTPTARRAFAYKLAGSIAMAMGQPESKLAVLYEAMTMEIAKARASGLQELGQRDDDSYGKMSRFESARLGRN